MSVVHRNKPARYLIGATITLLMAPFFILGFVAGCVYVATVTGFVMVEDFRNWIL